MGFSERYAQDMGLRRPKDRQLPNNQAFRWGGTFAAEPPVCSVAACGGFLFAARRAAEMKA